MSQSPVYKITEAAREDLSDIWLYTFEKWSQEQADRYYNLLTDEIEYIAIHFDSGKKIDHIRKGYRSAKVKSHFIFYRKSSDGITEIIRILHQSMDIERRLK